ncbi:hypothetical protein ACJJTC_010776 [Scirpophaga incertulas]
MSQPKTSYANVTSTTVFPKKDQAIVLDSIDGITLREYLLSLSSIIPATSIRFISRISNARICIYLDSKKSADKLIEENKKITVKNHILEIKPLISRNKRIVLSNVCPVIPNHVIEKKFEELNIKIMSPLTFMKIGVTDPGFSHILSFRRQLYISPEDVKNMPESFQLSFEETNYWIYVSSDALKCFTCNALGHLSKNCPLNTTNNQSCSQELEDQTSQEIQTVFERNDDLTPEPVFYVPTTNELSQNTLNNLKGKKRMHSPTITDSSNIEALKTSNNDYANYTESQSDETCSNISDAKETNTKTKKKQKKIDSKAENEVWKEIQDSMTELDKEGTLPINLDQFISLMDNSKGKQNIKELMFTLIKKTT